MKYADDSLEWHDENELVRRLDVVEAVLNMADTLDDVVDVIMSVPTHNADRKTESKMETQKETQNSNLTFKTLEYCDICDHKGCEECIANALDEHCIPSHYHKVEDEPQTDCPWK